MKRSITMMKVAVFFGLLAETYLNAALPTLMVHFSLDAAAVQWLTSLYILTMGLCVPISAFLIKRTSTKGLFLSTLSLFLVGTALGAIAPNFPLLLVARIVQAAGASMTLPLMIHSIMVHYPLQERGSAMGGAMLVVLFAPAIGPTVGALLLQLFTWRAIFVATAIGAAALLVWALQTMERGEVGQESTGDLFSILLSITGFGAVVYGLQQLLARAPQRSLALGLLGLGVVALILFVHRQQRLAEPMLNLRTLENRLYRTGVLLIIITHLAIFGSFIVLPMYLVNVVGLLPFWAGVVMLPGGFIGALAPSIAGRLYDRLGARTLSMVGFFLLFAANLLFSLVAGTTNAGVLVAIYVLLMCGFGITLTPVQTHSLNQLQPIELTDGTAILNTCMLIASSMGGSLFIALLSGRSATLAAQGAAGDPFIAGVVFAYRAAAVVTLSGLALSLFFTASKGGVTKK